MQLYRLPRSGKTNCEIHADLVSQLHVEGVQLTGGQTASKYISIRPGAAPNSVASEHPCIAELPHFDSKKETLPLQGKWGNENSI